MICPKNILVDVVKLSKKRCEMPIASQLIYGTPHNFTGRKVNGYQAHVNVCLMTNKAAEALCRAQIDLNQKGFCLKIIDAYRPKQAVSDFLFWSQQPVASEHELTCKQKFYPDIEKSSLFSLGYIAEDSAHCYGHTADVTLFDTKTGKELEMGTSVDFFGEESHVTATAVEIGMKALSNRTILSTTMESQGFIPHEKEWWHFSYEQREVNEPMSLEITSDLAGMNVR